MKINTRLSAALLALGVSLGAHSNVDSLSDELLENRSVPSHFLRSASPDTENGFAYDGNSSCSNAVCW